MQLTLHATRRTPHGASRLVQGRSAVVVVVRSTPTTTQTRSRDDWKGAPANFSWRWGKLEKTRLRRVALRYTIFWQNDIFWMMGGSFTRTRRVNVILVLQNEAYRGTKVYRFLAK